MEKSRKNTNLLKAKKTKDDEFYTYRKDIEEELSHYIDYDKDVFKDKVVLLPCDNPEWSQFTKYFVDNFESLGLKKLISTSIAEDHDDSLFASGDSKGRIFTMVKGDVVDSDNIPFKSLEGSGDFRSDEVTKLRDQSDVIITNPPFSLFRAIIEWTVEANCQFIILGPTAMLSYKIVRNLIASNKAWIGNSKGSYRFYRNDGESLAVATKWLTNIEYSGRKKLLQFKTMKENLESGSKKLKENGGYVKYDNYDAIEVPTLRDIPSDYHGLMGVPVTIMCYYHPEGDFELIDYLKPILKGEHKFSRIIIKLKNSQETFRKE